MWIVVKYFSCKEILKTSPKSTLILCTNAVTNWLNLTILRLRLSFNLRVFVCQLLAAKTLSCTWGTFSKLIPSFNHRNMRYWHKWSLHRPIHAHSSHHSRPRSAVLTLWTTQIYSSKLLAKFELHNFHTLSSNQLTRCADFIEFQHRDSIQIDALKLLLRFLYPYHDQGQCRCPRVR